MKTTRSELLDLVYHFYPRGMLDIDRMHVPAGELVYVDTEEHCRLMVTAARGRRAWPTWKAMIRRLGDRFGVQDDSLHLIAGNIDSAYSGRVWLVLGKTSINFHVSLLGPDYGIHLPGIPEEEPVAREIAREIEATYPGYTSKHLESPSLRQISPARTLEIDNPYGVGHVAHDPTTSPREERCAIGPTPITPSPWASCLGSSPPSWWSDELIPSE